MRAVTIPFFAFLVSSAASATLPVDASAQDYITPSSTTVSAPFTWTGFYLGAHTGYGGTWLSGNGVAGGKSSSAAATLQGFIGGLQGGYNYEFSSSVVIGVEGDFSFSDVKLHHNVPALPGAKVNIKSDDYATAAMRLGYAFRELLIYAKGGAAWTSDKAHFTDGAGGFANDAFDRTGFVVGAGVEYALGKNWSIKSEYNYLQFPVQTQSMMVGGGVPATRISVKAFSHIGKFGINYRF